MGVDGLHQVSTVASASMAATASAISSNASGPMMCTPRISPYCLVRHHLDEAVVLPENRGPAVGRERELADLHLVSLGARLRFGQSHAADARLGISRARECGSC